MSLNSDSDPDTTPTIASLLANFFCKAFSAGISFRLCALHGTMKSTSTHLPSVSGLSVTHLSTLNAGAGLPRSERSEIGSTRLSGDDTGGGTTLALERLRTLLVAM